MNNEKNNKDNTGPHKKVPDMLSLHIQRLPRADRSSYTTLMRQARIQLTKDGFYDKRMMSILKRARCTQEPEEAECALTDE